MKKIWTVILMILGVLVITLSFFISPVMIAAGADSSVSDTIRNIVTAAGLFMTAAAAFLLLFPFSRLKRKKLLPKGAAYEKRKSIMTKPELEFYRKLDKMIDDRKYVVIPQPALNTAIEKRSGGGYYSELFRLADFLIATSTDFEPVLFIELNDASHQRNDRKERDEKVLAICEDAGMPIITVDYREKDDEQLIKNRLRRYL